MTEILGPEWFSEDPETRKRLYEDEFAGRYHTNWDALRAATASSFLSAGKNAGNFLLAWQSMLQKPQARAETAWVAEMNYQSFVFGPLLSTVLLSAFTLESFVRLCAEAALGNSTSDSTSLRLALGGFEAANTTGRLGVMLELAGAAVLPGDLAKQVDALTEFRNGCAHDAPLLNTPGGLLLHVKRGQVKRVDEASLYRGIYPPLHSAVITLSVKHARRAIETHDGVVNHVATTSTPDFREALAELCPGSSLSSIEERIPQRIWEIIDNQVAVWDDEFLPWKVGIPIAEFEQAYRDMARKSQVRLER